MKDWCMKHPWMTFFLLDSLFTIVGNIVSDVFQVERHRRTKLATRVINGIEEVGGDVVQKCKDIAEKEEKRPIGFAV